MTHFALFNSDRTLRTCLTDSLHVIPADAVELTNEQYEQIKNERGYIWQLSENGTVMRIEAPREPLSVLIAARLADLNHRCQRLADTLTATYPAFEKLTWEAQQREALAWQQDPDAPTPYLDGIATARGLDRVDFLQRTLSKVTAFNAFAQQLIGTRQRYEDQLTAATTVEELDAIAVILPDLTSPE